MTISFEDIKEFSTGTVTSTGLFTSDTLTLDDSRIDIPYIFSGTDFYGAFQFRYNEHTFYLSYSHKLNVLLLNIWNKYPLSDSSFR